MQSGDTVEELSKALEDKLLERYDMPLLGGEDLRKALGYSSTDALRQAIQRGYMPIPVFSIKHRRGQYALVKDIADWLAISREKGRGANEAEKSKSRKTES